MKKIYRFRFLGRDIEDSIYMKTLELGYKNDFNGISFNEAVYKLNIDLSDEIFEVNFAHWFYTNFYNEYFEYSILAQTNATTDFYYFNKHNYQSSKKHNDSKSYIRGDSLNKYIDFLELKRTRKSSKNATIISMLSILIAVVSIIIPRVYPEDKKPFYNIETTNNRNECCKHEFKDSTYGKQRTKKMNNTKTYTSAKLESVNQY